MLAGPKIHTVRDHIAWAYANLARSHAAVREGCTSYSLRHNQIRSRLFKGLTSRSMSIRSLYENEKEKIKYPQVCAYCGASESLTQDHLIPRIKGGSDEAYNLIWACRSHNSAKGARDFLHWLQSRNEFPTILLLERYIKLVARFCETNDLMARPYNEALELDLPFRLDLLPYSFPTPDTLLIWIVPKRSETTPRC